MVEREAVRDALIGKRRDHTFRIGGGQVAAKKLELGVATPEGAGVFQDLACRGAVGGLAALSVHKSSLDEITNEAIAYGAFKFGRCFRSAFRVCNADFE